MSSCIYNNLFLAFDIGYSSIGWSVFEKSDNVVFPEIVGSGVYLFDDDACQNKARSGFRRVRRNIAARRNRIARIRKILLDMNVMTADELDNSKTEYPWLLAARVLSANKKLSWSELWSVIRYYAHNRGYDGNKNWARIYDDEQDDSENRQEEIEQQKEDAEKEKRAKKLMSDFQTTTQAETICAFLDVDPKSVENPKLKKYFKGENVAFPRDVVKAEVERIIDAHIGVLPKCDQNFKQLILGNWRDAQSNISLPKTFTSNDGLLFGQYLPRFDNRIISKCPITKRKVPIRHSYEYLDFRWKSLLSNMTFQREDISQVRAKIDEQMQVYGRLTKTTLNRTFNDILDDIPSNYESMFLTSEMENALLHNPVKAEILKTLYPTIGTSLPAFELVNKLWNAIPKFVFTRMFKFKSYSIADICALLDETNAKNLRDIAKEIFESSPSSKKSKDLNFETVFNSKIKIKKILGRAPYSRESMKKACDEIMRGIEPRAEDGALYRPAEFEREDLLSNIDTWTNNHLVRHRLKMFKRLYLDIVSRYANGDITKVKSVTIEVVKDLTAFSGLDIKEKKPKLEALVAHHKSVYEYLKTAELDSLNGSMLRKARIADDLYWRCPYTGKQFSPRELFDKKAKMELEHIIPYSLRPSNSLESLVITWKEVNDMKGQRTAMEFIKEFQGEQVPGRPDLTIITPTRFREFVNGLTHPQHRKVATKNKEELKKDPDIQRIKRRNALLLLEHFNKRERNFLPSDLTQTSHLNKLAFKVVKSIYVDAEKTPELIHLPGSVTSAVRKNWELMGCIAEICPEVIEESQHNDSPSETELIEESLCDTTPLKTKDEIRSITHLHHAVDAITMGLTAALFPHTTRFYELVSKRRLSESEREELRATGLFEFSDKGWRLVRLTSDYLNSISKSLAEKRVVKHLPKKLSGLKVEQTLWGIVQENENGTVKIRQYTTNDKGDSRRKRKTPDEGKGKLLGFAPKDARTSKLTRRKSVIVINRNYGVALTNPPQVIPFHKVWQRLQEIADLNGGKIPQVLRKNQVIEIPQGRYQGIWRIMSVKENANYIGVDMLPIIYGNKLLSKKGKGNVRLTTLLKNGMKILKERPTGI